MWAKIKAFFYAVHNPDTVYITIVRRYADAQKRFIGELYLGTERNAQLLGASCDNLPFNVGLDYEGIRAPVRCALEFKYDFLAPLPENTIRVGGWKPEENELVRQEISKRRYCRVKVFILNRFVEHILESDHV